MAAYIAQLSAGIVPNSVAGRAVREEYSEKEQMGEDRDSDGESIAELYRDIYEQAAEMGTVGEPEVTKSMVERIGEHGYAVVDEENQIDMVGSEQVLRFCDRKRVV